jgi:MFS family permease
MAARFPSDVRPGPATRRARLAVAALFFANGCGLGSWVPHIPDVKLWHGLSDAVLGLALLAIAAGAVAALPVAGALVARSGSRRSPGARRCCSAPPCRCRCSLLIFRRCSPRSRCSGPAPARSTSR